MKTLKNWKKFNEDMWTSTSTADYQEPSQVQAQAQTQTQVQETPAVDSVIFKIPAVYQIRLNEEKAFGYATDIDEVVSNLTEQGFEDSYWVKEQYEYWYKSKLRDMGNREDDNDGEDYHELDFSDSFNEWIEEEFSNWVKFIEQFNTVESCEYLESYESNNIYERERTFQYKIGIKAK